MHNTTQYVVNDVRNTVLFC